MHSPEQHSADQKNNEDLLKSILSLLGSKFPVVKRVITFLETDESKDKERLEALKAILTKDAKIPPQSLDATIDTWNHFFATFFKLESTNSSLNVGIANEAPTSISNVPLSHAVSTLMSYSQTNDTVMQQTITKLLKFNESVTPKPKDLLKSLSDENIQLILKDLETLNSIQLKNKNFVKILTPLTKDFINQLKKKPLSEESWELYKIKHPQSDADEANLFKKWLGSCHLTEAEIDKYASLHNIEANSEQIETMEELEELNWLKKTTSNANIHSQFKTYISSRLADIKSFADFYSSKIILKDSVDKWLQDRDNISESSKTDLPTHLANTWIESWEIENIKTFEDLEKHPLLINQRELVEKVLHELTQLLITTPQTVYSTSDSDEIVSKIEKHIASIKNSGDFLQNIIKTVMIIQQPRINQPQNISIEKIEELLDLNHEKYKDFITHAQRLNESNEQSKQAESDEQLKQAESEEQSKQAESEEQSNSRSDQDQAIIRLISDIKKTREEYSHDDISTLAAFACLLRKSPAYRIEPSDRADIIHTQVNPSEFNSFYYIIKNKMENADTLLSTLKTNPPQDPGFKRLIYASNLLKKPEAREDQASKELFAHIKNKLHRQHPFSDLEITLIALFHKIITPNSLENAIALLTQIQNNIETKTNDVVTILKDLINGKKTVDTNEVFKKLVNQVIGIKNIENVSEKAFTKAPQAGKSFLISALGLITFSVFFFPTLILLYNLSSYTMIQITLLSLLVAVTALLVMTTAHHLLWKYSGIDETCNKIQQSTLKPFAKSGTLLKPANKKAPPRIDENQIAQSAAHLGGRICQL